MSSVTAILRKKANKQGLFPIAIRITKNRKSSYIYTGYYIELNQWDETKRTVRKNHPNSKRLNNLILSRMSEVSNTAIDIESTSKNLNVKSIKKQVLKNNEESNFFKVAKDHLDILKERNQHHQAQTEQGRLEVLKTFNKSSELSFEDMTESFLVKFKSHLIIKKKRSERTVVNYLILIRTVFNIAIRDQIISKDIYPFGRGKITIRIPESKKIGLNKSEVKLLENADLTSSAQRHALNVWLFSFYLAGIRVGDVLKLQWKDFSDGRISYRMSKNKKLVSLKLPEKALAIIETYKESNNNTNDFVFPDLDNANLKDPIDVTRKIRTATRTFNRHLKVIATEIGIEKNISMHIARHTFGNISGAVIPIQMLQKLYRHSSVTTTINYQSNFIFEEEDQALDAVLKF
jgi:integrase/recombinase XerD